MVGHHAAGSMEWCPHPADLPSRRTLVVVMSFAHRGVVLVTAVLAATLGSMSTPMVAAPLRAELPPSSQRVYFVTESVGLGATAALPAAFPPDWQVTVDGTPALFVEQLESKHVRQRVATTPDVFGDAAVVAGGHNFPFWDPARFDRSVDSIIAALHEAGAEHVFWVTLREVKPEFISASAWREAQPFYWYFPTVNQHLEAALARNPHLTLIGWAAIADRPGITYDAIHLNTAGAALYSDLVATTVMDTLNRPAAGSVQIVQVGDQGSPAAHPAAVAVNLTVTSPRSTGYLTAYPCSQGRPQVSNANFVRDQVVASAAIVPIGADGTICVFGQESAHVIVDISGAFPTGAGFVPLTPTRLADTRVGNGAVHAPGQPLVVPVLNRSGVPPDAQAVVMTVTATEPVAGGFATVTACGTPPTGTSNVNFDPGATVPNLVIVAPGDSGAVCVTSNVSTHLIVDVFGSFAPAAGVGLVEPLRIVDTRLDASSTPGASGVVIMPIAGAAGVPADATGVMLNLTAVGPDGAGFLTAYPCNAGRPTASNLNVRAEVTRANFVLVAPDDDGKICVFTSTRTDVVVDLLGWVGDSFVGTVPTRVLDTRLS